MEVPSNRCGFTLEPTLLIERGKMFDGYKSRLLQIERDQWYAKFNVSCCWRTVWNDTSRCIWHAEVENKPSRELLTALSDEPKRNVGDDWKISIDGVYLRNFQSNGGSLFRNTRLIGADLSSAHLEGMDISGAALWGSNLSGTDLSEAFLSKADFCKDISDEELDIPVTWVSADLSKASFNGADLQNADLTYVNLSDTFANSVDFSGAELEMADFSDASLIFSDLSDANLLDADLSHADLRSVDLRGATIQNTKFSEARMNRETRVGKLSEIYIYSDQSEDETESFKQIIIELIEDLLKEKDPRARAYHRLGEVAKDNGLTGKARRFRIGERKARRKEAFWKTVKTFIRSVGAVWSLIVALLSLSVSSIVYNLKETAAALSTTTRSLKEWVGLVVSGYVMGYGISILRVSMAIVVIIFFSAFTYWSIGIKGGETFLQALDYSVTTFTGAGLTAGLPGTQPARSIVILESFAGILFSVLLGYVLGTRESP